MRLKHLVDRTDSFIYLSTDIGIGGAVVRDGEVVMGSHGFAVLVDVDAVGR